jgi:hypothetical protein
MLFDRFVVDGERSDSAPLTVRHRTGVTRRRLALASATYSAIRAAARRDDFARLSTAGRTEYPHRTPASRPARRAPIGM